jgi:hypothetical protein
MTHEQAEQVMELASAPEGHGSRTLCGSRLRQKEGSCRKPAGWGTSHVGYGACRLHGGNTSTQVTGAQRRQVEDGARRVLAGLGIAEPVANPLLALQQLAGEILALKDALRGMVEQLKSVRYGAEGGEQIRGEVILYERALDRCTRILVDIARLGIDERLARISEQQGELVAHAIGAILNDLNLTAEQRALVPSIVPKHLRAIATRLVHGEVLPSR